MNSDNTDEPRPSAPTAENSSSSWKEIQRERRLRSLGDLARDATSTAAPSASEPQPTIRVSLAPAARPQPLRRLILSLLALAVVVSGVGVYLWRAHQAPSDAHPIPATLVLHLKSNHLYCPSGLTWSPDGLTLAAWVIRTDCHTTNDYLTVLALFDACTGDLQRTIDPYAALAALNVPTPYVQSVVWSQDRSFLIFLVGYQASFVNATPSSGLLYYPLKSGAPHYVAGPAALYTKGIIWNLESGKATVLDNPLPTAVSYTWGSDGSLTPEGEGSTTAASVSLWRAGTITAIHPLLQDSSSRTSFPALNQPPVALVYLSATTLISPDGQFAAVGVIRGARLPLSFSAESPAPDKALCDYYQYDHLCDVAPLTPTNAAISTTVTATSAGYTYVTTGSPTPITAWNDVALAYRPDGKVLAAILPDAVPVNTTVEHISLLNTTNGAVLGTVSTDVVQSFSSGAVGDPPLSWSPTGKQLATFDNGANTLTLWGGSSLPA